MGTGRPSLKRPLHVPVSDAHTRITENVRRTDAGYHLSGADDVDQITRPTDGHAYFYDTTSGLFKPMLAPPFLKFNYPSSGGALTVSASDEDPVADTGKIINVNARLKTAGSSTTTAILKKNASTVVTTFTFASSSHTATWTALANTSFVEDDYFWIDLTAAGTGAKGLVIDCWATAA